MMKKKLFAALTAALMLGSTMAAPVSAAETYKDDAQCILMFATAKTAGLDVEPVSFYEEFRRNME